MKTQVILFASLFYQSQKEKEDHTFSSLKAKMKKKRKNPVHPLGLFHLLSQPLFTLNFTPYPSDYQYTKFSVSF